MFDIGAEAGYETILAANLGMKVYAFEPDPSGLKSLEANVKAEKISHLVTIVPKAVSDFDGQAEFFFGRQSTLVPTENCESSTVDVIMLSTFIKEIGQSPDFVKVDAEGANLGVVKGFPFKDVKPALWSVEYEAHEKEIESILRDNAYGLIYALYRPVRKDRRAIFWKYSTSPDFQDGVWGDIA
ncbi:MAG: FkbM family methyltransferase [Saprospirales bacterium]|nr:FkbM family methyltransferase [Saprospirales bacterium]